MEKGFSLSDLAQQIIGGYLLAGPVVVTEEVWMLAGNMTILHFLITVLMVIVIGFVSLYQADKNRDYEKEGGIGIVPIRLVSLILVAYLSGGSLILVFNAVESFGATPFVAFKTMSVGAIFSVVGAAAVDSIL